jgi:hypothetical protein
MVFSTMQPKCSPKEYFNKIGIEANIRFRVRFSLSGHSVVDRALADAS